MRQTQIFALNDDLLPLFAEVECKGALRYSLSGRFLEPRIKTYSSGAEIPNLSVATHLSASSCARYLGSNHPSR